MKVIINRHRTSTSCLDSQKSFTFAGFVSVSCRRKIIMAEFVERADAYL